MKEIRTVKYGLALALFCGGLFAAQGDQKSERALESVYSKRMRREAVQAFCELEEAAFKAVMLSRQSDGERPVFQDSLVYSSLNKIGEALTKLHGVFPDEDYNKGARSTDPYGAFFGTTSWDPTILKFSEQRQIAQRALAQERNNIDCLMVRMQSAPAYEKPGLQNEICNRLETYWIFVHEFVRAMKQWDERLNRISSVVDVLSHELETRFDILYGYKPSPLVRKTALQFLHVNDAWIYCVRGLGSYGLPCSRYTMQLRSNDIEAVENEIRLLKSVYHHDAALNEVLDEMLGNVKLLKNAAVTVYPWATVLQQANRLKQLVESMNALLINRGVNVVQWKKLPGMFCTILEKFYGQPRVNVREQSSLYRSMLQLKYAVEEYRDARDEKTMAAKKETVLSILHNVRHIGVVQTFLQSEFTADRAKILEEMLAKMHSKLDWIGPDYTATNEYRTMVSERFGEREKLLLQRDIDLFITLEKERLRIMSGVYNIRERQKGWLYLITTEERGKCKRYEELCQHTNSLRESLERQGMTPDEINRIHERALITNKEWGYKKDVAKLHQEIGELTQDEEFAKKALIEESDRIKSYWLNKKLADITKELQRNRNKLSFMNSQVPLHIAQRASRAVESVHNGSDIGEGIGFSAKDGEDKKHTAANIARERLALIGRTPEGPTTGDEDDYATRLLREQLKLHKSYIKKRYGIKCQYVINKWLEDKNSVGRVWGSIGNRGCHLKSSILPYTLAAWARYKQHEADVERKNAEQQNSIYNIQISDCERQAQGVQSFHQRLDSYVPYMPSWCLKGIGQLCGYSSSQNDVAAQTLIHLTSARAQNKCNYEQYEKEKHAFGFLADKLKDCQDRLSGPCELPAVQRAQLLSAGAPQFVINAFVPKKEQEYSSFEPLRKKTVNQLPSHYDIMSGCCFAGF